MLKLFSISQGCVAKMIELEGLISSERVLYGSSSPVQMATFSTIHRWVLSCVPQLDKRFRSYLKQTNDSWRVNETYIKVTGEGKYLYQAVDSDRW